MDDRVLEERQAQNEGTDRKLWLITELPQLLVSKRAVCKNTDRAAGANAKS
jgi:hypothetical protein